MFLPKASHLMVSRSECTVTTIVNILTMRFIFQHEFYISQAWWIATGIDIKMQEDVQAKMRRDGFVDYWTEPETQELEPLEMIHVMASLLLLSGGLILALITFIGEKLQHRFTKKTSTSEVREAWTVTNQRQALQ